MRFLLHPFSPLLSFLLSAAIVCLCVPKNSIILNRIFELIGGCRQQRWSRENNLQGQGQGLEKKKKIRGQRLFEERPFQGQRQEWSKPRIKDTSFLNYGRQIFHYFLLWNFPLFFCHYFLLYSMELRVDKNKNLSKTP